MSSIENFNLLERFASMRFCGNIVWSLNVAKFKAELRIALMSSGEVAQKSFNPRFINIYIYIPSEPSLFQSEQGALSLASK